MAEASSELRACPPCVRALRFSSELGQARRLAKRMGMPFEEPDPSTVLHPGVAALCEKHAAEQNERVRVAYEARDLALNSIGFRTYQSYLRSRLWLTIRVRTFMTFGKRCSFCKEPASQIHHSSYDREVLLGFHLTALYPVCRSCHEHGERFDGEHKATPEQATRRMKKNCEVRFGEAFARARSRGRYGSLRQALTRESVSD